MSSDFYILRKLISDDGLIFVKKNDYGEFFLELSEPGIGGTGYKIQLLNPPTDTIAIKSDLFPPPIMIRAMAKESLMIQSPSNRICFLLPAGSLKTPRVNVGEQIL